MKKILIILVLFLIGLVYFSTTRSKNYDVQRSIIIDAPIKQVWSMVSKLEKWSIWSPWAEKDKTVAYTFEGISGAVGSKSSYTSEKSGSGTMEIISITEYEEMTYEMHFLEPWDSKSNGFIRVEKVEEGTKVSWGFAGEHNFMSKFMNMNKMVGPDFARGLELLKEKIEAMPKETEQQFEIKEKTFEGKLYVGIRYDDLPLEKVTEELFASSYAKIMTTKAAFGNGAPSALYFTWDLEKETTNMVIAMPITEKPTNLSTDFEVLEIKAAESVYIDYYGSYAKMEGAHSAIYKHIIDNGMEEDFVGIEEYVTDPSTEPNSSKWLTKITYVNI